MATVLVHVLPPQIQLTITLGLFALVQGFGEEVAC